MGALNQEQDFLFICLGYSGIASGIDIYSEVRSAGFEGSFYPVRFSRNKLCDSNPVLGNEERNYLLNLSKEKKVIIYDEDLYSGKTLDMSREYFEKRLFGRDGELFTTYNLRLN